MYEFEELTAMAKSKEDRVSKQKRLTGKDSPTGLFLELAVGQLQTRVCVSCVLCFCLLLHVIS